MRLAMAWGDGRVHPGPASIGGWVHCVTAAVRPVGSPAYSCTWVLCDSWTLRGSWMQHAVHVVYLAAE